MKCLKAVVPITLISVLTFLAPAGAVSCEQAIIDKMMAMYSLDTSSCRIDILSNPLKTAEVSPDNVAIRPLTQKEPLGLFTVMVKVTQGGETLESGQVRMKIREFADVVVMTDKIRRGEPLSKDKLTIKKMDITSLREKPLRAIEGLDDNRAKRNLAKGAILTTVGIEPTPDIEAGREVSIIYVDGLCRITTAGVALQSGLAGEYVKVKNKASHKIIVARVVDETSVAVDP